MAEYKNPNIKVSIEGRPCYVDGKKAMFHIWSVKQEIVPPSPFKGGHSGGVVSGIVGIVEFEDGTVAEVYPCGIQFADGGDFQDTMFRPLNGGGDSDD